MCGRRLKRGLWRYMSEEVVVAQSREGCCEGEEDAVKVWEMIRRCLGYSGGEACIVELWGMLQR